MNYDLSARAALGFRANYDGVEETTPGPPPNIYLPRTLGYLRSYGHDNVADVTFRVFGLFGIKIPGTGLRKRKEKKKKVFLFFIRTYVVSFTCAMKITPELGRPRRNAVSKRCVSHVHATIRPLISFDGIERTRFSERRFVFLTAAADSNERTTIGIRFGGRNEPNARRPQ